jgi:hypothetical protein
MREAGVYTHPGEAEGVESISRKKYVSVAGQRTGEPDEVGFA